MQSRLLGHQVSILPSILNDHRDPAATRHPVPIRHPILPATPPSCLPSSSCPSSSSCPLSHSCLLFPLDCACVGGARRGGGGRLIRGRLFGDGKLVRKVVLVLPAVEAGAIKESSGFLPSARVLGRAVTACTINACAIKVCAIETSSGSCHQGRCG